MTFRIVSPCLAMPLVFLVVSGVAVAGDTIMLTDTQVRATKPGARPRRLADWLDLVSTDLDPIDDHRSTRAYREQALARLLLAWSES